MPGRLADEIKQTKPFADPRQEVYFNLFRTSDGMHREVEELLKPSEISLTQYNVLRILRGAGPAGLPCGEIASRMITHDPDITRLVDRLERRALVARARSQSDRRVVMVSIATEGIGLLDDIDLDRRMTPVMDRRFATFTESERTLLIHLLERLRQPDTQGTLP